MRLPDRVLVVTDRVQAKRPLTAIIEELVQAGARWVWLRERDLPPDARRRLAGDLLDIVRPAGARLTIGGDAALAKATGADGVHLPAKEPVAPARECLGPGALIGVSAHSLGEVAAAAAAGADYATLSPIFASASKPGYGPPLGLQALTKAAELGLPILALGGVSPENAARCRAAGAAGVAAMGAIIGADDPAQTYRRLAHAVEAGR
jgi:thiamine-phosphate pyrophosphorylase